ncbi:MAG: RNA 2',3'-cyclic phosphodiesterase [Chloroflexota bacterium]|nr:RNA 2',3'-cyclic phosphodiesterase [Chloroflexota bacterium]
MSERLRLFVAVEAPAPVRDALTAAQAEMRRRTRSRLRWMKPDALHLTLRFLGEIDAAAAPQLSAAVERAASGCKPFALRLARVEAFPGGTSPRVVWVGIDGDLEALEALRQAVEAELEAAGFTRERRRFVPHVTLARVPGGVRPDEASGLRAALPGAPLAAPEFAVERVALIHSTLTPEGSVYRTIARAVLTG